MHSEGIERNHAGTNESTLTMPRTLRVNDPTGEPIGTADSPEGVKRVLENLGPGRYHVDEFSADPFRSRHTSRRWGVVIAKPDGTVIFDRDPWPM